MGCTVVVVVGAGVVVVVVVVVVSSVIIGAIGSMTPSLPRVMFLFLYQASISSKSAPLAEMYSLAKLKTHLQVPLSQVSPQLSLLGQHCCSPPIHSHTHLSGFQ